MAADAAWDCRGGGAGVVGEVASDRADWGAGVVGAASGPVEARAHRGPDAGKSKLPEVGNIVGPRWRGTDLMAKGDRRVRKGKKEGNGHWHH